MVYHSSKCYTNRYLNADPTLRISDEMWEPVDMYRAEVEEFSRAIQEGPEPSISAESGLRSQAVLAACYKSAQPGRVVSL